MARRGENIYKRKDGRWEGRYIKGRKENGAIIYGYVYNRKYSVLKIELMQYKIKYQNEKGLNICTDNLKSWLEKWLDNEVENKVKISTYASYKYKISRYIIPFLGEKKLKDLTESYLQKWINKMVEKKLSNTTICLNIQILRMAIKCAIKHNYLVTNPLKNLVIPKIKKNKVRALSIREQKIIEMDASQSKFGVCIFLSLYTGLRIGEVSALKWKDIDFSNQLINVQRTIQRIPLNRLLKKTQLVCQETKSSNSERSIPFSNQLKSYLLHLKDNSKSDYVTSSNKKPLEPRSITYHFRKILKKNNLNHLHFHQLRHTFATRALEVGGDIASISYLLGHHSIKFTLDVYVDSLLHQRRNIVKKIANKYLF